MQPIRQQIIVTKQSLFRVIIRKLDFSCCSFDWFFFPDRWAPVLTKSLRLVLTPKLLKLSLCLHRCEFDQFNMLHLDTQKPVLPKLQENNRQAEMEKRKTSVRLLTFVMFGMPLCWMLFCVERESGRECEGEISGATPKLSLLQQIQSGTDLSFCPCSSHQSQQPNEKGGRTCRDVD